jgi:hypothetical protein
MQHNPTEFLPNHLPFSPNPEIFRDDFKSLEILGLADRLVDFPEHPLNAHKGCVELHQFFGLLSVFHDLQVQDNQYREPTSVL